MHEKCKCSPSVLGLSEVFQNIILFLTCFILFFNQTPTCTTGDQLKCIQAIPLDPIGCLPACSGLDVTSYSRYLNFLIFFETKR